MMILDTHCIHPRFVSYFVQLIVNIMKIQAKAMNSNQE